MSVVLAKMPEGKYNAKQLQLVKNNLYRKYSDHTLTKHRGQLPPGFFADHTMVNRYIKVCAEAKAGKDPVPLDGTKKNKLS